MVGWHHRLDGHEYEQAPGVGDGQGSLVCCSPGGCKELDMTQRLNNNAALLEVLGKRLHDLQKVSGLHLQVHLPSEDLFKTTYIREDPGL